MYLVLDRFKFRLGKVIYLLYIYIYFRKVYIVLVIIFFINIKFLLYLKGNFFLWLLVICFGFCLNLVIWGRVLKF